MNETSLIISSCLAACILVGGVIGLIRGALSTGITLLIVVLVIYLTPIVLGRFAPEVSQLFTNTILRIVLLSLLVLLSFSLLNLLSFLNVKKTNPHFRLLNRGLGFILGAFLVTTFIGVITFYISHLLPNALNTNPFINTLQTFGALLSDKAITPKV